MGFTVIGATVFTASRKRIAADRRASRPTMEVAQTRIGGVVSTVKAGAHARVAKLWLACIEIRAILYIASRRLGAARTTTPTPHRPQHRIQRHTRPQRLFPLVTATGGAASTERDGIRCLGQ